jgi:MSHA biogenesis protein MshL
VQNQGIKNNKIGVSIGKFSLVLIVLAFTACSHQSKVKPSSGHIDGKANPSEVNQNTSHSPNVAPIPKLVRSAPQLPPPQAVTKAQTYSVVVNEVPVKEILFALARESKINVDIHPSIDGRATLNAVDQTLPAILERLAKQVDLTYKMDGDTLYIAPDSPVLKTYQINYVNMQRTTKGSVSVANEIASASNTTVTGSGGTSSTTSSSGSTGASNTSSTSVESESKNYFWDSLIQNIKDILAESDKEVLIRRISSDSTLRDSYQSSDSVRGGGNGSASSSGTTGALAGSAAGASASGNQALDAAAIAKREAAKESSAKEYRQLFAANVIANKETGVLSVRATERQHKAIQDFIDRVQTGAKRQVLIEASIVEITLNDDFQAGVDWSRVAKSGDGFTFNQELLGNELTSAPRFAIGFSKKTGLGNLAASVRLLQTFGDTKVLSSPKLMVLNSQTAILKVVNNLVYFTVNADTNQNQTNSFTSVTTTPHTIPVGVWMSVTPQINENTMVTLNVRPTIARQSGFKVDPNPALNDPALPENRRIRNEIPEIEVREMESMLQVGSGNTVVLGGLMQDEIAKTKSGIPGLVSTPVVGNAFGVRDSKSKKTELVIFLRPTVISNASLESDELQSYKQYLPAQQLQNVLEDAQ